MALLSVSPCLNLPPFYASHRAAVAGATVEYDGHDESGAGSRDPSL